MGLNNPGSTLVIAETQVFNGAAPLGWTDLDLSAVVGAQEALVFLKFKGDGTDIIIQIRRNGDTDAGFGPYGMTSDYRRVAVPTDGAGIIEVLANNNDVSTIDIEAYIV